MRDTSWIAIAIVDFALMVAQNQHRLDVVFGP